MLMLNAIFIWILRMSKSYRRYFYIDRVRDRDFCDRHI